MTIDSRKFILKIWLNLEEKFITFNSLWLNLGENDNKQNFNLKKLYYRGGRMTKSITVGNLVSHGEVESTTRRCKIRRTTEEGKDELANPNPGVIVNIPQMVITHWMEYLGVYPKTLWTLYQMSLLQLVWEQWRLIL